MLRSKRSTGFIGNISNDTDIHYQPYNKSKINITNILKNISLDHLQDNDNVELDHRQHGGGVVRSTAEGYPGTNMLRREHLNNLKIGSFLGFGLEDF
jgi:hypothetical protein